MFASAENSSESSSESDDPIVHTKVTTAEIGIQCDLLTVPKENEEEVVCVTNNSDMGDITLSTEDINESDERSTSSFTPEDTTDR